MNLKLKLSLALMALFGLFVPGIAAAHISVTPDEAPAEGYAMLDFTVPHGCDGKATTAISVQMPPPVVSAVPQEVAGWTIKTKVGKLAKPVDEDGEKITEGVREVTWTGGPLPDDHLQQFGLSVALAGTEGETAEFKLIQSCEGGAETAWIQSTPASGEEPEHPAPFVSLGEPEADHHGGMAAGDKGTGTEHAETVSGSDSEDGSSDGLAIAALIIGALGLAAGGTALVTARRSR